MNTANQNHTWGMENAMLDAIHKIVSWTGATVEVNLDQRSAQIYNPNWSAQIIIVMSLPLTLALLFV